MLENLLAGSGDGFPRLKNTGPGPKDLVAWQKGRGFFGELTADEFISANMLSDGVSLLTGTDINNNSNWLKFYRNKRVLFVSKLPLIHS